MWRSTCFGQEPRGFSWLRLEFHCPVTFQRQCDFFLSYKFTWLVPLLWALVVYSWATKKRVSGDNDVSNSIFISRFYEIPTWGRSANKPEPALLGSTRTVGRAEHRWYVHVCIVNKKITFCLYLWCFWYFLFNLKIINIIYPLSSSSSWNVDREGMVILTGPLRFAFFAGGSSTWEKQRGHSSFNYGATTLSP